MNLQNKIILVTGASGGLGSHIALYLSKLGATVVIHHLTRQAQAEAVLEQVILHGGQGMVVAADIRNESSIEAMVKTIKAQYGRLDGLVNNAAILLRGFIAMQRVEALRKLLDTNIVGSMIVLKAVAKLMIFQKKGVIVNVSSLAGIRGLIGQSAYACSKAALNQLTVVAAKELAGFGIRVNGVAPGAISTGMLADISEEERKRYDEMSLAKRMGKPDEVAAVVAFLLSEASSYIYGQVIPIDGGLIIA